MQRNLKLSRLSLIFITLLLCTYSSLSEYSQIGVPKDLTIKLERTMCFGWCPAYGLRISGDGIVEFTPQGSFAQRGDGSALPIPLRGTISHDGLQSLLAEFKRIGFFKLRRHYGSALTYKRSSSCPEVRTDSPTATITIVANGKRKTIDHYLGCNGSPTLVQLEFLERLIDDTANTQQWTSKFGWGAGSVVDLLLSKDQMDNLAVDKIIQVRTKAADPENDLLQYSYAVSGGRIIGNGAEVTWDLTTVPIGTYTITAAVDDGCGPCGRTMTKTVTVK